MTIPFTIRILVVDDDPFTRMTIKRMLGLIGQFQVMEAGSGAEALSLVTSFEPNLILCDINMAPMSGLQLVQQLRWSSDPKLNKMPVIMLTGNAVQETVMDAIKLGISGYLVKSLSATRLREQLAQQLRTVLSLRLAG